MNRHLFPYDKKTTDNDEDNAGDLMRKVRITLAPVAAGYVAGSMGIIVGHPLDSIKVLLQTNGGKIGSSHLSKKKGSSQSRRPCNVSENISTAFSKRNNHGLSVSNNKRSLLSLYAGASGPLLTVGVIQSINFALYDTFRRCFYHWDQEGEFAQGMSSSRDYLYNDSLINVARASALSGFVTSCITAPLVAVKTKQQIMQWGMKDTAKFTLSQKGGVKNFYKGYYPHVVCESIGRAIYMATYEYLKRFVAKLNASQNPYENCISISLPQRMLCAGLSGITCWSLIFPFDVIRSRIYAQSAMSSVRKNNDLVFLKPRNCWELAKSMWNKAGIQPFYRGYSVSIARAGPVAASVLPVYDLALDWLTTF